MLSLHGPDGDMGVIVARFQTPYLTEGHRELIESVKARHQKFAIILGVANVVPTKKNPLDFGTRYAMLQDAYPGVIIGSVYDTRSDEVWSKNLDNNLRGQFPNTRIVLYGSRDSFKEHYTGKFPVVELDEVEGISATKAREAAEHTVKHTEDFRRGVIYNTSNQYRKNVLCVDVAVMSRAMPTKVLLGRKTEDGNKWRFFGGHVNVGIETAEAAGRREVLEETGCDIDHLEYVGSTPIKDWRYAGSGDSIFTIFYTGLYFSGPTVKGDDIDGGIMWIDLADLDEKIIVEEHHVLLNMLLTKYGFRGKELHKTAGADTSEYEQHNYPYTYVDGKKVFTNIPEELIDWTKKKEF